MSFVQAVHGIVDAVGTTCAATAFTSVTAGDTISGQFIWQDVGSATLGLSDGTANVYTVDDTQLAAGFRHATWHCKTTVGGALTITGTVVSTQFKRIQARQDTSLGTLNKHVVNTSATFGTVTDAVTSTAQITTVDGCTIIGFAFDNSAATLPTAGTSFTGRDGFTNAAGDALLSEERVQASQGSVAATFTTTAGTDQIFVGMLAFAPAAAPALGYRGKPGPGISPSRIDQFRVAPQGIGTTPPATITGVVGAYSWGGSTATVSAPGLVQFYAQPGPGVGPFSNNQFQTRPSGFAPAVAVTQISAGVGAYSWAGTTASTTQLVNASAATWTWAGTTAGTSQLLNASVGAWSWAGLTAATSQSINASPGAWSWAGATAGTTQLINSAAAAWTWAGTTATLGGALNASPGTYSWAGTTAEVPTQIAATAGAWSWSGTTADTFYVFSQSVGAWSWAGTTATTSQLVNATPGSWAWAAPDSTIDGAIPVNAVGGEYGKSKRRYQIKVGTRVIEGTKESVQKIARDLAIADANNEGAQEPTVAEILVPAKRKKPAIVAITPESTKVIDEYRATLREASKQFVDDDEEALIALLI